MDMCWYMSSCLVACVCRYVVVLLSCISSCSVSRLGSFRYVVRCKVNEVVCDEIYAGKLV